MWLIGLLVFACVFWGGYVILDRTGRARAAVPDRLAYYTAGARPRRGAGGRWSAIPVVERIMGDFGLAARIELLLDQADLAVKPFEFVLTMAVSGLFLCALGLLGTHRWGLAVVLALVGGGVPIAWALGRRGRRRTACVRQLPDALQTIASALRAGLGFAQGISMVADHLPPPIAVEFARAQREMTLGLSVEEALQNMSRRVQSLDFDLAVSGILINRQIGGNLAELLDHIIVTLRERVKLKNFIRVQTAQQRLSAWIIVGIGPALLLLLIFAMRDYTRYLLVTTLGHVLLGIALLLQVAGAVIIRRVIAIDV